MNQQRTLTDLSHAHQNYIKAIWEMGENTATPVTTKMLSDKFKVSPSTISESMKRLAETGLVEHQPYGSISLSEHGRVLSLAMVRRHRLIESFLVTFLDYTWDEVSADAELLEHAISEIFLDRIDEKLGYPARDPHGDPIPTKEGTFDDQHTIPLPDLEPGHSGSLLRISDSDPQLLRYLDSVAINLHTKITVIEKHPYVGIMKIHIEPHGHNVDLPLTAAQALQLIPTSPSR